MGADFVSGMSSVLQPVQFVLSGYQHLKFIQLSISMYQPSQANALWRSEKGRTPSRPKVFTVVKLFLDGALKKLSKLFIGTFGCII